MQRLTLSFLGSFQARRTGNALVLPTRKAQALVAYLALPAGQLHARDELAALLWGGHHEESARNSVRQTLFGIRKVFAAADPAVLVLEGTAVALNPSAFDIDVAAFERDAAQTGTEALQRAAGLYRGHLLAGLSL